MFSYINCKFCGTLNVEPYVEDISLSKLISCKQCENQFDMASRNVFIVPTFGFIADGDKIEKPGLIKPDRTYRGNVSYIGSREKMEEQTIQIGKSKIELGLSRKDEMAVLNESRFYVCESCGFTDLDNSNFMRVKRMKHKAPNGSNCWNSGINELKRFSLGYRFETDVLQIRFIKPELLAVEKPGEAISVLYGILKGISSVLSIEQNDIAGCLQYFLNEETNNGNFSFIIYDKTPGGSGYVKQLRDENIFRDALCASLQMMRSCECGGELGDSSCYSCLRSYYNQKDHDSMQRRYVIEFLEAVIE
ncbi:MAG: DUF1998 domain-containing protein [Saccharofermentanales bacterium]